MSAFLSCQNLHLCFLDQYNAYSGQIILYIASTLERKVKQESHKFKRKYVFLVSAGVYSDIGEMIFRKEQVHISIIQTNIKPCPWHYSTINYFPKYMWAVCQTNFCQKLTNGAIQPAQINLAFWTSISPQQLILGALLWRNDSISSGSKKQKQRLL